MSFSKPFTKDGRDNCQQDLRWQENVTDGVREYLQNFDHIKMLYIVF